MAFIQFYFVEKGCRCGEKRNKASGTTESQQASVEVLQRTPDMGVGRKDQAAQDAAKLKQWEEWVHG